MRKADRSFQNTCNRTQSMQELQEDLQFCEERSSLHTSPPLGLQCWGPTSPIGFSLGGVRHLGQLAACVVGYDLPQRLHTARNTRSEQQAWHYIMACHQCNVEVMYCWHQVSTTQSAAVACHDRCKGQGGLGTRSHPPCLCARYCDAYIQLAAGMAACSWLSWCCASTVTLWLLCLSNRTHKALVTIHTYKVFVLASDPRLPVVASL